MDKLFSGETMLAAFYYNNKDIRIKDIAKPKIGPNEFLLKVKACGICGSDVMEWYRKPKAPIVLGHEATGTIWEIGNEIEKYKLKDRVFVSHHVPCNRCVHCNRGYHTACETLHTTNLDPGGFSQFVRVPEINVKSGVYKLPSEISFDNGTFIEPLGTVVRGQRLATINEDDTLLIIGSGITGILHIQLAKAKGVKKIYASDIKPYRVKQGKKFGADETINAKENIPKILRKTNEGRLVDKIIVCTGALEASLTALKCIDKGGTILFFALPGPDVNIPMPMTRFWRNEITIKTSYGAAPNDLRESLKLLSEKKIDVKNMISHRLGLRKIADGFQLVSRAEESLKVIIHPNNLE